MFNKKTLIVVGAGASKEGNLPTGSELKQRIATLLDIRFEHGYRQISGDHIVCDAIRHAIRRGVPDARDINPHLHSAWRIRDAMPQAISIDNFIDSHQGDVKLELCGKLAIVRSILEAERNSLLYVDSMTRNGSLNYQSLEGTWFNAFMQLLTENCRADQLEERLSKIELIVFNYDRCIEHFLFHSLQTYYGIDSNRAANIVCGIKIYHPYGTVGALPWYDREHAIEFGAEPDPRQLVDLADQIKTFTEGTDPDSSDVVAIRNGLVESHIVLFLGFAFHRLNLDLIRPSGEKILNSEDLRYFGTAKGISNSDCEGIKIELIKLGGPKYKNIALRNDLSCSQLFREYWRSLSLS
ncbi:MAG: hypothetical protein ACYC1T_12890 [Sulfuricaulis sp.]